LGVGVGVVCEVNGFGGGVQIIRRRRAAF
jgi:hypothetical protein